MNRIASSTPVPPYAQITHQGAAVDPSTADQLDTSTPPLTPTTPASHQVAPSLPLVWTPHLEALREADAKVCALQKVCEAPGESRRLKQVLALRGAAGVCVSIAIGLAGATHGASLFALIPAAILWIVAYEVNKRSPEVKAGRQGAADMAQVIFQPYMQLFSAAEQLNKSAEADKASGAIADDVCDEALVAAAQAHDDPELFLRIYHRRYKFMPMLSEMLPKPYQKAIMAMFPPPAPKPTAAT